MSPPDAPTAQGRGSRELLPERLLGVELDDQLLGDLRVDLRPLGELVHEDAQVAGHDLQPAGIGRSPTSSLAMMNGSVAIDLA